MRLRVSESERLIRLADSLGWPSIKEDFDASDLVVQRGRLYVYWRHKNGELIYASDNLGPIPKPYAAAVEAFIRDPSEVAKRAGLTPGSK